MTRSSALRGRHTTARITLAVAAAMMLTPAIPPSWSGLADQSLRSTAEAQSWLGSRRATRFLFFDICHKEPCSGKACCVLSPWQEEA